jgi:hypothetical protein
MAPCALKRFAQGSVEGLSDGLHPRLRQCLPAILAATAIEARQPRLTKAEKDILKGGGTSSEWKPARPAQIDRGGRWTIRRGRRRETPIDGHKRQREVAAPMFGHKTTSASDASPHRS